MTCPVVKEIHHMQEDEVFQVPGYKTFHPSHCIAIRGTIFYYTTSPSASISFTYKQT